MTPADARTAALDFGRETLMRCVDEAEPWEHGHLIRTPALDQVWSLNGVIVERPAPGLTLTDLEALLDEQFARGRFASVVLEHEATAERIEPDARSAGWRVEHELFMALRRDPDRPTDTSGVREATEEEVRALLSRWFAEDHAKDGPEALRQLDEYGRREWHARPTRAFVSGDGQAMCKLWAEGGIVQVEDVYTAPEARGRGHARTLLSHALTIARGEGPELVFIVADDDDTPKELYARMGFEPIARLTRVVRERRA